MLNRVTNPVILLFVPARASCIISAQNVMILQKGIMRVDTDVIVVGAGLSGLVAARELEAAGLAVIVMDKGSSVGGRLATRRVQAGLADHGAQFFTVRTDDFKQQVQQWLAEDVIYIWGYGWSDGSLKRTAPDGHPRYVAHGGMNSIAKYLANTLTDVRVTVTIEAIDRLDNGWQVRDSIGNVTTCRALILTPPVPQSLALLHDVPLREDDRFALERIEYGPCLCGIFVVEGDVDLPEPGALQDFHQEIYWIADNQRKGISPERRIITTHAEARGSRQRYDEPDEDNLAWLRAPLEARLKDGAKIVEQQLKKWRYSVPLTTYPEDCLVAEGMPLAFAGDAFGGRGRIEGAYLSGLAAGRAIRDLLKI